MYVYVCMYVMCVYCVYYRLHCSYYQTATPLKCNCVYFVCNTLCTQSVFCVQYTVYFVCNTLCIFHAIQYVHNVHYMYFVCNTLYYRLHCSHYQTATPLKCNCVYFVCNTLCILYAIHYMYTM